MLPGNGRDRQRRPPLPRHVPLPCGFTWFRRDLRAHEGGTRRTLQRCSVARTLRSDQAAAAIVL